MNPQTSSTSRARWGMLLVAAFLAVALSATGLVSYVATSEAADAVAEGRATDLFRASRNVVRRGGASPQDVLDELMEELGPHGLRFVAVETPLGDLVVSAGEAGRGKRRPTALRGPGAFELTRVGDRVRVEGPLRRIMRPRARRPARRLVLEYQPTIAAAMVERALTHLVVSGAAALLLLVASLLFWRLGRRAEAAEAELARDRRLAALGEMSAVLGHELRNPLASLKGHAQLVQERLADDPMKASADRVVSEAKRLEVLTGHILDFAKTGAVDRHNAVPADVIAVALRAVPDSPVRVDAAEAPSAWSLDADRMAQVLTNLIVNAVQASPPAAAVDVSCRTRDDALVFEVRDRGPGLDEATIETLFEPFHTTRTRGSGLGLAIVKRIVDAHGGTIRADNHPGGGARFQVALPRGR